MRDKVIRQAMDTSLRALTRVATSDWVEERGLREPAQRLVQAGARNGIVAAGKLMEAVKSGRRPSDPNWELLRSRSDDTLQAARSLVLADGKVQKEEIALLERLLKEARAAGGKYQSNGKLSVDTLSK